VTDGVGVGAADWLGAAGNEADDNDGEGVSDGPPTHATNKAARPVRAARVVDELV